MLGGILDIYPLWLLIICSTHLMASWTLLLQSRGHHIKSTLLVEDISLLIDSKMLRTLPRQTISPKRDSTIILQLLSILISYPKKLFETKKAFWIVDSLVANADTHPQPPL